MHSHFVIMWIASNAWCREIVLAEPHFDMALYAHTWHGASHDRDSCCCCRPQSYTKRQNLSASLLGNDVASGYLGQHVAKEKAGLYKTRHCGAPAKVLSHGNDSHTDIDFVLQIAQRSALTATQQAMMTINKATKLGTCTMI